MLGQELAGLFEQLPRGLIVLTCGSGLAWIFLMVYFAVIRPARKRRQEMALAPAPLPAYIGAEQPAAAMSAPAQTDDLPDLMMLTGPETLSTPVQPAGARRLGSVDVKLADGGTVHAAELLLILRDPRDNSLIVQSGDVGHKALANAPETRALLKKLLSELGHQQGGDTAPAPTEAAPRPVAPPAPQRPPVNVSGPLPGDLPKFSEIKDEIVSRGAFRPAKTEMPPVPDLNISGAIETYLQYRKSFSPEYARRSIHILPGIGGSVRIEVDGNFYDAVSDVTDPDVRAFLQETIAEWQSRQ